MADTVALIGNGASLVYAPELALERLATDLRAEFGRIGGGYSTALLRLAQSLADDWNDRDPARNFEALLGPVDRLGLALGAVLALDDFEVDKATADAMLRVRQWLRELYEVGLGLALPRVAQASTISIGAAFTWHGYLADWLLNSVGQSGTLRLFTLNYDVLLDAQFLRLRDETGCAVSDQADGRAPCQLPLVHGEGPVPMLMLRDRGEDEWLSGAHNVVMYHLHGSLQWLREKSSGAIYKATHIEDLRSRNFFDRFIRGDSLFEPVVVLTDRKKDETLRAPFADAYARFEASLVEADYLVVAGYGFGDEPVNAVLRRTLAARHSRLPQICVVTHAPGKADFERGRVLGHLAVDDRLAQQIAKVLTVAEDGLPGAIGGGVLATWPQSSASA